MTTMADLIGAQTTDANLVASTGLAVTAATNANVNALSTESTDAVSLAAALAVTGPQNYPNVNGTSVDIYTAAPGTPGYTIVNVPNAAGTLIPVPVVTVPDLPPLVTPAPVDLSGAPVS